jgi:hypothetical protein
LESQVAELSGDENEVKNYHQLHPRKPSPEIQTSKDDFGDKEAYQKIKKLREVVIFAIEKALDDLHYIELKLHESSSKAEVMVIYQILSSLIQVT